MAPPLPISFLFLSFFFSLMLITPPTPSAPAPSATETARPATEARILRVWLPPQFDPNAGTASANLLQQRLADFEAQHPGVEIEVRVKSEEGEANMLNAL